MRSTYGRDVRVGGAGIPRAFAAGLGAVLQAADVLVELGAESAAQAAPTVRSAARAAEWAYRGAARRRASWAQGAAAQGTASAPSGGP